MRILLHICCAPCSIHPYRELKSTDTDSISGFFYNPNIHPFTEYQERKKALEDYSRKTGFPVVFHKYDVENFFREVSGNEALLTRCRICWRMRLEETANFAKNNGFDGFSTTLLVSPYQDQEEIKRLGMDVSKRCGVNFLYKDFRSGFRSSQQEARQKGLYCQKYCGCIFSEKKRYEKSGK